MNDLTNLTGISGSQVNLLMWNSPTNLTGPPYWGTDPFQHVHVRVSENTFPGTLSEGEHITNVSGSGDSYVIHRNIDNGVVYYYSLWAGFGTFVLGDTPLADLDTTYYGPYHIGPLTPANGAQFCNELKISFTKLETNTRLFSRAKKLYTADVIIWLSEGQENRKNTIIQALKTFKPAHTIIRVFWEPYYVAQTTTAHFSSGSFDSDVYTVENGTLINIVPTIDSSFGGNTSI